MKILFVLNSLVGGGAEKVFVDMLKNLDYSQYDIDILLVDEWGVHCEEVRKIIPYQKIIRHVTTPRLVRWFFGGLSVLKMKFLKYASPGRLHRRYIKGKYDVEIAYIEGIATKIVAGCEDPTVMKYAWIHTDMVANPWASEYYRNKREEYDCYQRIDKVVAVSKLVKESVEQKFGISAQVLYNVLDSRDILEKAVTGTRRLQTGSGVSLVSVGTLWRAKGYLRLLQIIGRLLTAGYDLTLHLIGEGEDRSTLEAYIRDHDMQGRVILYGFQKDPYDLLQQADAYICSSYVEGFSTTVTEALILGVPVITTDCAGMEELLGSSEYGMIVENSDEGLYQGIKKFLEDEQLRQNYRDRARARGKEFSIKARIDDLQYMFQEDMAAKVKEDE